jgi:hypothetical protein
MKPTTDIVEELRLYNRWRRGDEAITAPDPTTLGKLIDDAADRIEHLFARGIHTCHDDCQRPMCVLRRERDKALADLAALRARVESATPDHFRDATKMVSSAKHPDTERLDAIEDGGLDVFESHGEWYVGAAEPCRTLRSAIDAARKQGGTP